MLCDGSNVYPETIVSCSFGVGLGRISSSLLPEFIVIIGSLLLIKLTFDSAEPNTNLY